MKRTTLLLFAVVLSALTFASPVSSPEPVASPEPAAAALNTLASSETVTENIITGKVLDENTAEVLAGVCLSYNGQKIYTDLEGNFSIKNISKGTAKLTASMISYEEQLVEIKEDQSKELKIKLKQR